MAHSESSCKVANRLLSPRFPLVSVAWVRAAWVWRALGLSSSIRHVSSVIFHEDTEERVWENASEHVSAEQRDKEHTLAVRQAWVCATT